MDSATFRNANAMFSGPTRRLPSSTRVHFVMCQRLSLQARHVVCGWSAIQSLSIRRDLSTSASQMPDLTELLTGRGTDSDHVDLVEMEVSEESVHDKLPEILKILKVNDKFRYHKVPKLKALRLKLAPSLVLKVLQDKEVKPSISWKFFVWAKKQMQYKHTVETYNTIIATLLEIRKFTSVYFLMEDMHKVGVDLTPETCLRMAKTFGRVGMVERAIHALKHMTRVGNPATTQNLNSVVSELLKSEHHYKAYVAVKEMAIAGCEPNVHTFKSLFRELARVKKVELGCHIYHKMKALGLEPDVEMASSLVGMLVDGGEVEEALLVFEKIRQTGVRQNARVYTSLLYGLGNVGNVDRAFEIFEEMHMLGYYSNMDSVDALVGLLASNGRVEDAERCRDHVRVGVNKLTVNSGFEAVK